MTSVVTFRLNVEGVKVVADAIARNERDVLCEICRERCRVSVMERIRVLVVKVDQILRDFLSFLLVGVE